MFFERTVFTQQATDAWLTPATQGAGTSRAGAYLIQGKISGHDRAYSAVLSIVLVTKQVISVDILVTRNGQILEMVSVPAGIRAVKWRTSSEPTSVVKTDISFRPLSWLEYRVRQLRRALPAYCRQTPQRRASAGFKLSTFVTDLDYAYSVSCRIRANAYMHSYSDWYAEFYGITPDERRSMKRRLRTWKNPPHFHVFIITPAEVDNNDAGVDAALDKQIYPHFVCIRLPEENWVHEITQLSHSTEDASSWSIILRPGVTLSDTALFWLADAIDAERATPLDLVYTDQDEVAADGRLAHPVFKPDWSPELLRATNYIGDAFAWRSRPLGRKWDADQAARCSMNGALHSLLLAINESPSQVAHVCAPLWHVDHAVAFSDQTCGHETADIVSSYLSKQGIAVTVSPTGQGRCHVRYALPTVRPLVSIVIPTRDGLSHLRLCIDSLLTKTSYLHYEVIVIDNQSVQPETLAYLQEISLLPSVRVLPYDDIFNYSKINNYAVAHANGELICLLNNDTEVISPDWLEEMVGLVLQPGVGIVGTKLLYGNDTVQHGGDTVGPGGCANHLHSGIGRDDPGYAGRALVAQDLSAVTAACLLTHKTLYQSLAGLDEINLTVAFNDVDFCLRVREAGLRVVWTPHALLYHHESISRGKDTTPAQVARASAEVRYMRTRWAHLMHHDPFYNPNLNYQHPDFGLSNLPHVEKPWARKPAYSRK